MVVLPQWRLAEENNGIAPAKSKSLEVSWLSFKPDVSLEEKQVDDLLDSFDEGIEVDFEVVWTMLETSCAAQEKGVIGYPEDLRREGSKTSVVSDDLEAGCGEPSSTSPWSLDMLAMDGPSDSVVDCM